MIKNEPSGGQADSQARRARSEAEPSGGQAEKVWGVLDLLRWTREHFESRKIDSPRLDAECLLAFALGVDRLRLYIDFDQPVGSDERAVFRDLVRRRADERVPVSILVGGKEFWSMPLRLTGDVLAPRPESETLVAAALELLPDREAEVRVLDVGTGSGAIALALARERPKARITATDISAPCLKIARENAEALGFSDRFCFLQGPGFEPVSGESFDLVVSNPPYLAETGRAGLAPELAHEPPQALFAGPDGLDVLQVLVSGVCEMLTPGAGAAFELSPEQAPRVADWCRNAGLLDVTLHRDLGNRDRVVSGRRELGGTV